MRQLFQLDDWIYSFWSTKKVKWLNCISSSSSALTNNLSFVLFKLCFSPALELIYCFGAWARRCTTTIQIFLLENHWGTYSRHFPGAGAQHMSLWSGPTQPHCSEMCCGLTSGQRPWRGLQSCPQGGCGEKVAQHQKQKANLSLSFTAARD